MNCWTTYTGVLITGVKACAEPAKLFGTADNRRTEH